MAQDSFVTPVDAHVEIRTGEEIRVTDIEINRTVGVGANHAQIKGIVSDTEALGTNDIIRVYINDDIVFTGLLKKATEDEKGIVTIDAYDPLIRAQNDIVRLNIDNESGVSAYRVLTTVLQQAQMDPQYNYQDALDQPVPLQIYVAPQSTFPGGDDVARVTSGYGSGDRGEPLPNVLADLASRLHINIWCDRNGVVHFQTYPSVNKYTAQYILQVNAGEDAGNTSRIIVKGGSPVGTMGPAAASIYTRTSPTSFARTPNNDGVERTITDNNIVTQKDADTRASSEAFDQNRRQNPGSITVTGNTSVGLFDSVEIPKIYESQILLGNTWTVKGITHTLNTQNGFRTSLELAPQPSEANVSGPAAELAEAFLARVEGNTNDVGNLGAISGFDDTDQPDTLSESEATL